MIKGITTINEPCRKYLGITRDEYALCQFAHYRAADPRQKKAGWCCDKKEDVADFVGITRAGLYKMLDRMALLMLIEVDPIGGNFRATPRFIDAENEARKSVNKVDTLKKERVNKVDTDCKQSLHGGVNKVTVNIEGIGGLNKEGKEGVCDMPTHAPLTENQKTVKGPALDTEKKGTPPVPAAPLFSHRDKPQDVETHTDLLTQIQAYYKANPREWIDSVKAMSGPTYTDAQLLSMLQDYCSHNFSHRNPYQKFSQHNSDFCRWVKNQKTFTRKEQPAPRPEPNLNHLPKFQ